MTENEVRDIAATILKANLGARVRDVRVVAAPDHYGDPALFLEAELAPGTSQLGGVVTSGLGHDVRSRLRDRGEERFPFLSFVYPDEVEDEPAEAS